MGDAQVDGPDQPFGPSRSLSPSTPTRPDRSAKVYLDSATL